MTTPPNDQTGAAPPPDAAQLNTQLGSVLDYVRQCELRVGKGEVMDLSGLDRTVMQMCEEIMRLPSPQARTLQPRMQMLVEGLDQLAARMREQQAAMGGGAGEGGQRG